VNNEGRKPNAEPHRRLCEWFRNRTETVERFILELVHEERPGKCAAVVRLALFILSRVFAIAVKLRRLI